MWPKIQVKTVSFYFLSLLGDLTESCCTLLLTLSACLLLTTKYSGRMSYWLFGQNIEHFQYLTGGHNFFCSTYMHSLEICALLLRIRHQCKLFFEFKATDHSTKCIVMFILAACWDPSRCCQSSGRASWSTTKNSMINYKKHCQPTVGWILL